jgi:hypothetical protein
MTGLAARPHPPHHPGPRTQQGYVRGLKRARVGCVGQQVPAAAEQPIRKKSMRRLPFLSIPGQPFQTFQRYRKVAQAPSFEPPTHHWRLVSGHCYRQAASERPLKPSFQGYPAFPTFEQPPTTPRRGQNAAVVHIHSGDGCIPEVHALQRTIPSRHLMPVPRGERWFLLIQGPVAQHMFPVSFLRFTMLP